MFRSLDAPGLGCSILEDLRGQVATSLVTAGVDEIERERRVAELDELLRHANGTDLATRVLEDGFLREARLVVDREFPGPSLVHGTLLRTIGTVYLALGDHESAESCFRPAMRELRELVGEGHRDTLSAAYGLATTAYYRGDLDTSASGLADCRRAQEAALGEDDPDTLLTLGTQVRVAEGQGRREEAFDLARECVRRHEESGRTDDASYARALTLLSRMLILRGDYAGRTCEA